MNILTFHSQDLFRICFLLSAQLFNNAHSNIQIGGVVIDFVVCLLLKSC